MTILRCGAPRALLLLTLAHAASCAQMNPLPQLGFVTTQFPPEEKAIAAAMARRSSRVEVYRDFRTAFTARALYLAPEVRSAAAGWEVKSRLLDPAEAKAVTDRIVTQGAEQVEFLLGFYAPEGARGPLEDPAAGWNVQLRLADGRQLRAACLLLQEKESLPYMRFLRWDLSWSRLYRLCFPIRPDDPALERGMTLSIAGPDGHGEMAFGAPAVNPTNP